MTFQHLWRPFLGYHVISERKEEAITTKSLACANVQTKIRAAQQPIASTWTHTCLEYCKSLYDGLIIHSHPTSMVAVWTSTPTWFSLRHWYRPTSSTVTCWMMSSEQPGMTSRTLTRPPSYTHRHTRHQLASLQLTQLADNQCHTYFSYTWS